MSGSLLPYDHSTSRLDMKPVGYQSMPSSVHGGHQHRALDRVLSPSKVMYCEKCGFAAADAAAFEKHLFEHAETRFYCFYCNHVSFSEAELNAHLKQHTSKYPFKCPHCGQGYVRRLCLVKHIDRLHGKSISQVPAKPGMTIFSHVPVSGALSGVPTAEPPSLFPAVRVTVPVPSTPAARLCKGELRGKILEPNVSDATNGNTVHLSSLHGLVQNNRALTVSLPEEVTIPAGCLVELVEVKTVNGTKELKLRLVSQQENQSVIKDTRASVSQNTALGKPFSSTLNHPTSTAKSVSMGMCVVNRKPCETKTVNVERPAVGPVNVSINLPNQVVKEKCRFKRKSQEIINLQCNTAIPNKIAKIPLPPTREVNGGTVVKQGEPVNLSAAPSTVVSSRLTGTLHPNNMGTQAKGIPPQRTSVTKSLLQDVPVAVKLEPGETRFRKDTASKLTIEAVGLNQQRLKSDPFPSSVPPAAATQVRLPSSLLCKDDAAANQSYPTHRTLKPTQTPVLSNCAISKLSTCKQEVRSSERAGDGDAMEPESFPIISSVFSLSQQPEEVQGSMQPLVMALRGIVMDKNDSSGSAPQYRIKMKNDTEQAREVSTSGLSAQVAIEDGSFVCDPLTTEGRIDSVKVEKQDKGTLHQPALADYRIDIKEEKNSAPKTDDSFNNRRSVSEIPAQKDACVATDAPRLIAKSEHISKFLTVSLKRVQVSVWQKSRKGQKPRIPRYKARLPVGNVTDCAAICPMPLKTDQLVKRPGPNQPVVVLNHPKPRAAAQGADTVSDAGASEVVPKCQILKMRLSKVMGQKYEVKGCTVRVSP